MSRLTGLKSGYPERLTERHPDLLFRLPRQLVGIIPDAVTSNIVSARNKGCRATQNERLLTVPDYSMKNAESMIQMTLLSRRQRGFSMIELVTVMIIISVLAVVALPNFSLLGGYDELGYRDQVKATLEFARKAAVAQRRYACVSRSGNTLSLTIDAASPEGRSVATCAGAQSLLLPGSTSNSISPRGTITLLGSSAASVLFDPQGRPWTSASATVSTAAQFTVHGGGDTVITVEAETGYVH